MKINKFALLLVILGIAAVLRLWHLGSLPPHLTPDEAALGVNANLILHTGRDEHGRLLPFIFQSFGDYKPGLYVYADVPFVAVMGLTETSVRLPSAFAGIAIVFLIYRIVLDLGSIGSKAQGDRARAAALMCAGMAAINPWLITFSRGAWEVNLSLALTLAGVYFFLRALNKPKFIIWSAIAFAATLLTYQGAKLATLIVVVALVLAHLSRVIEITKTKYFPVALVTAIIISSPVISSMFTGQTGRLNVFSVFSYPRPAGYLQSFLAEGHETVGSLSYYLFHPEWLNFARGVAGRWFNHFSARFLFFEGDWENPGHSSPYQGQMLLVDALFLLSGFSALAKRSDRAAWFVGLWLILAPLPAALSRDQVQAVRSLNMAVPLIIIASWGLQLLLEKLFVFRQIRVVWLRNMVLVFCLGLAGLFSFGLYLDSYFVHLAPHDSQYWFWGYRQAVAATGPYSTLGVPVYFNQSYDQPYIYFMFYMPGVFRDRLADYTGGGNDVGLVSNIGNVKFLPLDWPTVNSLGRGVFVADATQITADQIAQDPKYTLLAEIKYLNNMPKFTVFKTK